MNSYFNLKAKDALLYFGTMMVAIAMVALLYQLTVGFGPKTHPAQRLGNMAATTTQLTPLPQKPAGMREISSGYYYP